MRIDLSKGPVAKNFLAFSWPLVASNLLQRCYSLADMFIVGYALGSNALVAVGSTFTLTTTLNATILGLCMGAGSLFSFHVGRRDDKALESTVATSFAFIGFVCVVLLSISFMVLGELQNFLSVPDETWWYMMSYLQIVFTGIVATFIYSFFACLVRAQGDSLAPFLFLALASVMNIGLDFLLVVVFGFGSAGAGWASVSAQYVSAGGMAFYAWRTCPAARSAFKLSAIKPDGARVVARYSLFTALEQLTLGASTVAVQPFVTAAGESAVAAFAVVSRIASLASSPLQGVGKAVCTFVAQNEGAADASGLAAPDHGRLVSGARVSLAVSIALAVTCGCIALATARSLTALAGVSLDADAYEWGLSYLKVSCPLIFIEGAVYLQLGYFRGSGAPQLSFALALMELLVRVCVTALAIASFGAAGASAALWWSAPIARVVALIAGCVLMKQAGSRTDVSLRSRFQS
jgi:putative MATE family efflux protein